MDGDVGASPQDVLFGVRLKRERELAGMSLEDVGRKMGCSDTILAHYESGHRRMPEHRITEWCAAVGITMERLMTTRLGDHRQHIDRVKVWLKPWRDLLGSGKRAA